MVKVALTTITPNAFGTRWRRMVHHWPLPSVFAAWTYSRVRTERTCPLTRRAVPSQDSAVSSRMIISRFGVNIVTRRSRSTRVGSARNVSITRIMTVSTMPPAHPATAP